MANKQKSEPHSGFAFLFLGFSLDSQVIDISIMALFSLMIPAPPSVQTLINFNLCSYR